MHMLAVLFFTSTFLVALGVVVLMLHAHADQMMAALAGDGFGEAEVARSPVLLRVIESDQFRGSAQTLAACSGQRDVNLVPLPLAA